MTFNDDTDSHLEIPKHFDLTSAIFGWWFSPEKISVSPINHTGSFFAGVNQFREFFDEKVSFLVSHSLLNRFFSKELKHLNQGTAWQRPCRRIVKEKTPLSSTKSVLMPFSTKDLTGLGWWARCLGVYLGSWGGLGGFRFFNSPENLEVDC